MRYTLLALLLLPILVFASQPPLTTAINTLISHELPNADVGVVVMDAKTGEVLYDKNSFQAFTPASNEKLFTAAAALFGLGPGYRYKTVAYINPRQFKNGILGGNLVIKFYGDPSLTSQNLYQLIANIKRKGIKNINGNVIIDNSYFVKPYYAPGWSQDDVGWYYSAPVTATIVNENAIPIRITPSKTVGKKARLTFQSDQPFINLTSNVKTVTYKHSMRHCSLLLTVNQQNHIDFTGCWPLGSNSLFHVAIANPAFYAEKIIKTALKHSKISITGKVKLGRLAKGYKAYVVHQSQPLAKLIRPMLKDSNNLYAESFLKTLGAVKNNKGSFQEGINAEQYIIRKKTDIDFNNTNMVDGSGASRYDLITPRQIARLLYVMAHTKKLAKQFEQSLPYSGQDGTLAKRMTAFDLRGHIKAKTGTMTSVSALSGYMTTESGRKLIFVMLMNHIVGKVKPARALQAEIAQVLYKL